MCESVPRSAIRCRKTQKVWNKQRPLNSLFRHQSWRPRLSSERDVVRFIARASQKQTPSRFFFVFPSAAESKSELVTTAGYWTAEQGDVEHQRFHRFCGNKQAKRNDAEVATAATLCSDDNDSALNPLHCWYLLWKLKAKPRVAGLKYAVWYSWPPKIQDANYQVARFFFNC